MKFNSGPCRWILNIKDRLTAYELLAQTMLEIVNDDAQLDPFADVSLRDILATFAPEEFELSHEEIVEYLCKTLDDDQPGTDLTAYRQAMNWGWNEFEARTLNNLENNVEHVVHHFHRSRCERDLPPEVFGPIDGKQTMKRQAERILAKVEKIRSFLADGRATPNFLPKKTKTVVITKQYADTLLEKIQSIQASHAARRNGKPDKTNAAPIADATAKPIAARGVANEDTSARERDIRKVRVGDGWVDLNQCEPACSVFTEISIDEDTSFNWHNQNLYRTPQKRWILQDEYVRDFDGHRAFGECSFVDESKALELFRDADEVSEAFRDFERLSDLTQSTNVPVSLQQDDQRSLLEVENRPMRKSFWTEADRFLVLNVATQIPIVDPSAKISADVEIESLVDVGWSAEIKEGVTLHLGARVGASTVIGACSTIHQFALVGWNSIIGLDVEIGTGALVLNDVTIEDKSRIGNNSIVRDNVRIGPLVSIEMESCICEHCMINQGVKIASHVLIDMCSKIGDSARIGQDVQIGEYTEIGPRVEIGPGRGSADMSSLNRRDRASLRNDPRRRDVEGCGFNPRRRFGLITRPERVCAVPNKSL